ncbi:hypothetical protein Tco_1251889 [Tanacetum coccineum]
MHTSKDDYLIITLRFVSRKEASQKYGAVLLECLTSLAMKESKAYKTYLGFATGAVPSKAARKFKKASPSKKDNVPIPEDEGLVKKCKRLKTAAKKSAYKPATSIVIREPAVETKSKRKEKEKVDVAHGKGIELLSDGNDKDDNNEEDISSDEGSKEENESDKQASDSEQEEESKDNDQEENKDDDDLELEINDETEGDEEMDDTTDQFDDDADARLEEPTETATGIVQGESTNVEMYEAQQGNENLATTHEQVIEDAHVTISTIPKKTKVLVTSSSCLSYLVSKFLNFSNIPHTDAEIVSPLDVPVHHEKDPLHTQVTSLVDSHLDTRLGETREEFMNFLLESLTARIKEQVSSQPPSSYEAAASLTEFELKKILIDKIEKKPTNKPKKKDSTSGSSKPHPKSSGKSVQSEEPVFEVADSDMPQDHEGIQGDNEEELRNKTTSRQD